jgi:hypothetical protein
LLIYFDLAKATRPRQECENATLSFFVWDHHDSARAKVSVFAVLTPWEENTVTWAQPADGKRWKGGKKFTVGTDTGPAGAHVVLPPDKSRQLIDRPTEYRLDVTPLARSWLDGSTPNYGLAIAPVVDPSVDGGYVSRFQVLASEYAQVQYTPTLILLVRP